VLLSDWLIQALSRVKLNAASAGLYSATALQHQESSQLIRYALVMLAAGLLFCAQLHIWPINGLQTTMNKSLKGATACCIQCIILQRSL
jgi:hypothetical protein